MSATSTNEATTATTTEEQVVNKDITETKENSKEKNEHGVLVRHMDMADRIQAVLSMDFEASKVKESEEGVAYKNEATMRGMTMQTVNSVRELDTDFRIASQIAVGRVALDGMKTDQGKDLQVVEAKLPMGNGTSYKPGIIRESTFRNPKTGEDVVSHGRIFSRVDIEGTDPKVGQMGKVASMFKEIAAEAVAKK